MNCLIDTNIILDIALKRHSFFEDSAEIFRLKDEKNFNFYISASTITDLYFIIKKEKGHQIAISFIQELIDVCLVAKVDKNIIRDALKSKLRDFEDAVQLAVARDLNTDCIITRNIKDFAESDVKIFTPKQFFSTFNQL